MIDLWPVRSGRISRWGWEAEPGREGFGMLVLEFRGGATWVYRGLHEDVLASFLLAESKGRFLDAVGWRGERVVEGLDWQFRRG